MKELKIDTKDVFGQVMAARDSRENFALVVEGKKAEMLFAFAPYYERFRDSYLRSRERNSKALWPFAWRAMRTPFFWGLCVLADFEAAKSTFELRGKVLRVEFSFGLTTRRGNKGLDSI